MEDTDNWDHNDIDFGTCRSKYEPLDIRVPVAFVDAEHNHDTRIKEITLILDRLEASMAKLNADICRFEASLDMAFTLIN